MKSREPTHSGSNGEPARAIAGRRHGGDDAEWRRRLFGLVDDGSQSPDAPAEIPDEPRGLRARAARALDKYLVATATELDERGERLQGKSLELEREEERLAAVESALDERAQRIRELGITDERAAQQLDELVKVVAERDERIKQATDDRNLARQELASALEKLEASAAEAMEQERRLAENEARATALAAEMEALRAKLQAAALDIARRDEIVAKLESAHSNQAASLATVKASTQQAGPSLAERNGPLRPAQLATDEGNQSEPGPGSTNHLLLVPGGGCYALIERPGPPPNVGEQITHGDHRPGRFVVTEVGESPLPHDQRACAYLQPAE